MRTVAVLLSERPSRKGRGAAAVVSPVRWRFLVVLVGGGVLILLNLVTIVGNFTKEGSQKVAGFSFQGRTANFSNRAALVLGGGVTEAVC